MSTQRRTQVEAEPEQGDRKQSAGTSRRRDQLQPFHAQLELQRAPPLQQAEPGAHAVLPRTEEQQRPVVEVEERRPVPTVVPESEGRGGEVRFGQLRPRPGRESGNRGLAHRPAQLPQLDPAQDDTHQIAVQ